MEAPTTAPTTTTPAAPGGSRRPNNRRNRGGKPSGGVQRNDGQAAGPSTDAAEGSNQASNRSNTEGGQSRRGPPRRRNPNRPPQQKQPGATDGVTADGAPTTTTSGSKPNPNRRRRPPRKPQSTNASETGSQHGSERSSSKPPANRRAKFGGKLTQEGGEKESADGKGKSSAKKPAERYKTSNPLGDDLASTLIRSLSTPPYPDCPICFSSIHPSQAIWSCSPLIPVIPVQEGAEAQYCWTPFHVGCIKSWAAKSVKDVAEAWRARGELDKHGDWRCPGCQAKREIIPSGYRCFCGTVPEPKLARLSTPHSCGQPCARVRESGCGHPCPLLCHPGPCPPCQVTSHFKCYCPRKTVLSFRCGVGKGKRDLSCGQICDRPLNCGKHACTSKCHDGDCAACAIVETVKCYCGKHEKEMLCGEGRAVDCFVEGQTPWIGRYACEETCERPFDCGVHTCQKPCHPPSASPAPCPRSPTKVTHCPCGRKTIAPPGDSSSAYDFSSRPSCQAPIPTCTSPCSKPHPSCNHPCEKPCHDGPCPPCTVPITRPCRCGSTTRKIPCHEAYTTSLTATASNADIIEGKTQTLVHEVEFLCERPCPVLRACGQHQCNRICCPLASLAAVTNKKGKKKAAAMDPSTAPGTERGGLHECDLVCGKPLSCGNHRCEERDHRGPCPRCLRSSFEELFCACGRTVLEPPVPCGTKIQCSYPCTRPPPPCGHPRTIHACHDDDQPCPPCPHLTNKQCACGKKSVPNVKCSLANEKVSCGTICGKLMPCGFHHCQSLCHSGNCGSCTAPCGKNRKLCLPEHHPCTHSCHAPSACPETDPCEAILSITCPCGRLKQATKCGKSLSNPAGHQPPTVKCTTECSKAARNARLAEALGINPDKDKEAARVSYSDEVVAFARANMKFVPVVEKAFADFVNSEKRHQVLPHMTPEKRKFVNDLAAVYRMDTQMIDQEPNRSVQLIRRIDTRIPTPTLSAYLASTAPNLGKLTDLRTLRHGTPPSPGPLGTLGFTPASASSSSSSTMGSAWRTSTPSSGFNAVAAAVLKNPTYLNVNAPKPQPSMGREWTSVVRPTAGGSSVPLAAVAGGSSSTSGSGLSSSGSRLASAAGSGSASVTPSAPPSRYVTPALRGAVESSQAVPPPAEPVAENWEDDDP
ncbi:shuttle craft protein [Coprinopsis cinerea AmutBmut pab1-1]|nr:shuttle craft protein [Coprinopsis cinerea AmutBmut pab1-1]